MSTELEQIGRFLASRPYLIESSGVLEAMRRYYRNSCESNAWPSFSDEIVNRIFDFVDAQSLVYVSRTCHRFRDLALENARSRAADMCSPNNPIEVLRVREQVLGCNVDTDDCSVPVPLLLLSRRVVVSGASVPVFDGVYHCTGFSGNGFVFSKPTGCSVRVSSSLETEDVVSVPIQTGTRPLRCVIAKKFSSSTLFWYMAREVYVDGLITMSYHYWSVLSHIDDESTEELCRYPSLSSTLLRQGAGSWQNLEGTPAPAPTLELL